MTIPIHPEALKAQRSRKRWTQEELCEATSGPNKVSLPTIKRIESTKEDFYPAQDRVALTLAKVLGVSTEELGKEPTERAQLEESLRKVGYRPLRTMIDAETALAFNMVQDIYGIPIRSQIEMAPLFMTLLAEGSLAWRRERVKAIEEASEALQGLGGGHSSYVYTAWRIDAGTAAERKSIEKKDFFGIDVSEEAFDCGYDRSQNNPFADYLQDFAKEVGAKNIRFDADFGWKTSEGLPNYRIGAEIIDHLTDDDPDAEYALLRGHVRMKDIPEELMGDKKKEERVAWMIAQIPEEELAVRKAERDSLMSLLDTIDLPTTFPKGGNDD
ncbi:helix-turn-helix domain-containing protein [Ruegeria aquimaris]|jgi:transcriptional regulator with XRE-family HTH domain|uniref:Helix-turn-helix domain-containing protein n=1 Tax=Ruegeria aquimaris TaxID=2984333 RepID=A0ABT3ANV6_9RHOB|nr:helix-turn-helix transcriptional regulator [Ruegeria sp. XHP0148]MCV2890344.1 helix-turn-helix domain-containing protein [Ruegeria sp. XHP0148]